MKRLDQLGISPWPWNMKTWQASDDYGTIVESSNHNTVCDCSWSALGDDQGEIDARLIAAAPDCYDALQRIVIATEGSVMDFPQWQKDLHKALDDAKSALAKASGEGVAT